MNQNLVLSATRSSYLAHDSSPTDLDLKTKITVIERDKYTCQCCGFSVREFDKTVAVTEGAYSHYLTTHPLDDNHLNNELNNLITVCVFCHAVFHTACASSEETSRYVLIFYPWLTQVEINLFCNLLLVAKQSNHHSFSQTAQRIYSEWEGCTLFADTVFENGTSNVKNLASALQALHYRDPSAYERRAELLPGMRLLPILDLFEAEGLQWTSAWLPSNEWQNLGDQWTN